MGAGDLRAVGKPDDFGSTETAPVDLRTRFDQFPATIKGAFVLRGADGNPHAVDLIASTVDRIPSGPTRPVPVGQTRVRHPLAHRRGPKGNREGGPNREGRVPALPGRIRRAPGGRGRAQLEA